MNLDLINTGDLLHCQGNGIIAAGIRLFTGTKVTHTAIAIRIWDQLYIIDAQRQGVFPRPYDVWLEKYNYKFEVQRNPLVLVEDLFARRAMSQSGSKYDKKLLLIEQPGVIIRDKLGIDSEVNGKFDNNRKFVCSEYAMWCHSVGDSHDYTPKMVKEYCDKNNWITIAKRD